MIENKINILYVSLTLLGEIQLMSKEGAEIRLLN